MISMQGQSERRHQWFQLTRERIGQVVNLTDGSGKIPQFNPPWREPVWVLSALYTGSPEDVALANRMVEHFHAATGEAGGAIPAQPGKRFNIFQSNIFAKLFNHFGGELTPGAREVMEWHVRELFKAHGGARQSDYKFHGANDNMPMMATMGHILGGEALGDQDAVAHGRWMLNQFRRHLSRCAWASEFNSITYTPITLSSVAKIATLSKDPPTRQLALDIEHRLWAEILLHFHPGTLHQAGPHSRAYAVDSVGHTHTLQVLLWLIFGSVACGYDPIKSFFESDNREVVHFCGHPFQNIAEFCDMIDTDFHVPADLAPLISKRRYPSLLRGRTEVMSQRNGAGGQPRATTYMQESFSLGSTTGLFFTGEQTTSVYATYRYRPEVKSFRDAGTLFAKYLSGDQPYGALEHSADGSARGEKFTPNLGWFHTLQHTNTVMLLSTPSLKKLAGTDTTALKLSLIFPAHFGKIRRSIIGRGPAVEGAHGTSSSVAGVSVDLGEVFAHVQPLLPTLLSRRDAVRFCEQNQYELLELYNYEGPARKFSEQELAQVLNGFVLTMEDKKSSDSLETFHSRYSRNLITDYLSAGHRYVLFQRNDVELEAVVTLNPFGVQTQAINGRPEPDPLFESDQIDPQSLPFMTGPVARNAPHFPWGDDMRQTPWENAWLIGSRGLPTQENYSNPSQGQDKTGQLF